MNTKHVALAIAAALTISSAAQAQDIHFGFNVGRSMPQSDAKDLDGGYTAGFWVPFEFNGGHTIRPRLDYTSNKGNLFIFSTTVTTTHLGVDYLYNINGKAGEGFYLLAGLGYAKTQVSVDSFFGSGSGDKSAFAFGAGLGYEFTPMFGIELRYASTHPGSGDNIFKNDYVNVSATFRF